TGGAVGSSTPTGAPAAGATGTGAGAGTGGARGAAGTAGRLTIGAAGWGAGRGGGAGAAGRDGDVVTLGGANGPAGCRDGRGEGAGAPRSSGRNGTILGSGFFGAAGPGGGAIGATGGFGPIGSGSGATTVGSGTISGSGVGTNGGSGATSVAGPAGFGFTIVAAGLTSTLTSLHSHRDHIDVADRTHGYLAEHRDFGLSCRRWNSLTPTRGPYHCRQVRIGFAGLLERVAEPTPSQRALDARGVGAHVRAPSRGSRSGARDDRSVWQSHQPHER